MAEDNNTDKTRKEFQSIAEETAAIFGNTLRSIAASFSAKLRENSNELDDLGKSLLRGFKNDIISLAHSASSVLDIQQGLLDGSIKQKDISKARQTLDLKLNKLLQSRNVLIQENGKLTKKQEEDYKRAVAIAEEQKNVLIKQEETFIRINKQLGVVGGAFKVIGTALKTIGLADPFQEIVSQTAAARTQLKLNKEELDQINNKSSKLSNIDKGRKKELEDQNNKLKKQSSLAFQIKKGFKDILSTENLIASAGVIILKTFGELNKAQTDLRRNLGESADNLRLLDDKFGTVTDQINTINSLTEQFGFNTIAAFDAINLREATELTKALGLSAEEAGMLAFNAQVSGQNLEVGVDQAVKGISPLLSQRKILQEISKVSPSIALAFKNSNVELAKAASSAKLLGLNLSQVDKIAEGLLDIESSLRAEFEAEVITGKQLNLDRARFFALTNKTAELTKEIGKNQAVIDSFSTGTRIEQQAIADSLGLSRDELAKMVQEQTILNGMSAEDIKAKEVADFKRLTVQQSINDSIAKMGEALAVPLEALASIASNAGILYSVMAALGVISLANTINSLATMATTMGLMSASAITTASAVTFGVGLIAIGAGISYLMVQQRKAEAEAKQQVKVNDGIAPASRGPFTITDSYGATAITARGDSLAVSPNIRRETRNEPNTTSVGIDYDKLANAIALGAERGTSKANLNVNLDGNRISNNIQTPLAVNTRRYSV